MTNIVGELSNRKTAILDEISSSGLQGICWKCLCSYLGNTVNVKIGEENFIEIFNFLITQKFEFYESFEHHCYAVTNKYDIEETIINDDKHFISNKDHRGTCKDYKSRNRIKMKTSLNFNKFLKSLDEKKSRVIIVSSQENRSQLLFNHVYFQRFDIKVYALMERIAASKQFGISIKYGATYYKMAQHYFYFGSTLRKCIRRQYRQNRIWYINNVNKPSYVYLLKFYNLKAINTSLDSNEIVETHSQDPIKSISQILIKCVDIHPYGLPYFMTLYYHIQCCGISGCTRKNLSSALYAPIDACNLNKMENVEILVEMGLISRILRRENKKIYYVYKNKQYTADGNKKMLQTLYQEKYTEKLDYFTGLLIKFDGLLNFERLYQEMNHINRTIKRKQCIAFLKRAVLKGDIYMIDTYDTPLYYLKEVNEDHQLLLFIKVLAQSTKFWKKIDLSLYSITRHVIVNSMYQITTLKIIKETMKNIYYYTYQLHDIQKYQLYNAEYMFEEQNFSVKYIISSDENFSENRKFIMQDDHFIKHAEKPLVCVWKIANMLTLGNIKLMLNKPVNFKYFERVTNLSQGATHLEDENILPFGILPCSLMKYILLNLPIIAITACAMHLACLFGLLTFICPVSATYDLFHRIFAVNKLIKINETTFELARNTGYVSEEIFGYMNAMRIPFMACMGHNLFSHTYWTKSSKKYKYVFELMLTQHDFSNLPRIAQPMGDGEGLYGFDSSMQYRKSAVISSTALGKYTKVYKSTKKTKKMLLKFKKSVQELHIKHNQIMRKKKMKKRPHCQNKFNQEQDNYIRLLCIAERISETVRNIISTTKLKLFAILSKLEIFKPNSKYNLLVRYNVLYDACVNQNNFVIFYLNHNEEIQRDLLLIVDGTIDYISLCDFVGYNVKTFYQLPSEYHIYYYKKFLNLNKHTISEINQQLFLQFVTSYILHNDITFNNRVEFNVMSKQFSHIEKESYFQDLNKFDICFKMEPKKLSNSNMPFKFGKPLSRFYNILYNNTNRGFFKDYETVQSTIKETKYINFVSKGNAVFLIYNWLQNRVKFECDEISDKSLLQYITCTKFNTRGDFIRQKLMFRKYIVDIEKKFGTQDEMSFFTNFFNQNANELTHPDNGSYERILSNLSSKICNNYLDISESTLSQFIMLPNTSNSEYDKKSDMNNMLFNAIKIINFCKTFEERGVNTSDILKEFNESLGYKEEYIHFALNFIIFSKQIYMVGFHKKVYVHHLFINQWTLRCIKILGKCDTIDPDDQVQEDSEFKTHIQFLKYNKTKLLEYSFIPKQYLHIDGSLNKHALDDLMFSICMYVYNHPGQSENGIINYFKTTIFPIVVIEMLELLESFKILNSLDMKVTKRNDRLFVNKVEQRIRVWHISDSWIDNYLNFIRILQKV